MADQHIRDEAAEYRNAYLMEYASYKRAGRHDDAALVAQELRRYGVDVDGGESAEAVETAAASEPLENTALPRGDEATRPEPPPPAPEPVVGDAGDVGVVVDDPEPVVEPRTEATAVETVVVEGGFPRHVGAGWYELSNGERVRGREAAHAQQQELN